jgi:hypothetical protein
MLIYLQGDPVKGIAENHYIIVNPAEHLGTNNVVSTLVEKDHDGKLVGRTFHLHFVHGRADADPDALGRYLIEYGHALPEPWNPPADAAIGAEDPGWRWREEG